MQEQQIEWRPVPGLSAYEVSNLGRIRKAYTKEMCTFFRMRGGYLKMNFYDDGVAHSRLVHRVVMAAFVGPSKMQVNHIDGNKTNNKLSNLEYVTQSENIKHGFRTGLYTNIGEQNPSAKLNWDKVDEIRLLAQLKTHTHKQIAEMYGVGQTAITNIVNGKKWKEESRDKAMKN